RLEADRQLPGRSRRGFGRLVRLADCLNDREPPREVGPEVGQPAEVAAVLLPGEALGVVDDEDGVDVLPVADSDGLPEHPPGGRAPGDGPMRLPSPSASRANRSAPSSGPVTLVIRRLGPRVSRNARPSTTDLPSPSAPRTTASGSAASIV